MAGPICLAVGLLGLLLAIQFVSLRILLLFSIHLRIGVDPNHQDQIKEKDPAAKEQK